jgi:hypothetical protein
MDEQLRAALAKVCQNRKILVDATIESAEMDKIWDHLTRGRPCAGLSDHDLRGDWTKAFKLWFDVGDVSAGNPCKVGAGCVML